MRRALEQQDAERDARARCRADNTATRHACSGSEAGQHGLVKGWVASILDSQPRGEG
jgi:hypothetical protein